MEASSTPDFSNADGHQALASMRRVDWREWSLWFSLMSVSILLTLGITSLSLPTLLAGIGTLSSFFLGRALLGLWGLVLLLNFYVIYEQVRILQVRRTWAARLYSLAVVDPLTSLFNRRYIEQRLESEIMRSLREHISLTVIVFDLDSFKLVNDRCGHAVGDDVLKAFAERLKKATRGSDVAARYGGDEFVTLLSDCKPDGVQYVLKRLENMHIEHGADRLPIAFSAGWTDYLPGESAADLLKRADGVLYVNKRLRRGPDAANVAPE